jgi:hypothetical protein
MENSAAVDRKSECVGEQSRTSVFHEEKHTSSARMCLKSGRAVPSLALVTVRPSGSNPSKRKKIEMTTRCRKCKKDIPLRNVRFTNDTLHTNAKCPDCKISYYVRFEPSLGASEYRTKKMDSLSGALKGQLSLFGD